MVAMRTELKWTVTLNISSKRVSDQFSLMSAVDVGGGSGGKPPVTLLDPGLISVHLQDLVSAFDYPLHHQSLSCFYNHSGLRNKQMALSCYYDHCD